MKVTTRVTKKQLKKGFFKNIYRIKNGNKHLKCRRLYTILKNVLPKPCFFEEKKGKSYIVP